MPNRQLYQSVTGQRIPRSKFDLSYSKKFTADMGWLIPVQCDEVFPGDYWEIQTDILARLQPMTAPIMHEVYIEVRSFFVPYRLLWNDSPTSNWYEFITRGASGNSAPEIPVWEPTNYAVNSLWDYLGFQCIKPTKENCPIDFPRRAYNMIWNEYFRDQNLQSARALTDETIARVAWEKDYFTAALPWQQRGTVPVIPLAGYAPLKVSPSMGSLLGIGSTVPDVSPNKLTITASNASIATEVKSLYLKGTTSVGDLSADLSQTSAIDVPTLRRLLVFQKFQELSARAGVRPVEYISAHWGETLPDNRIWRPEYVGGFKTMFLTSEVLQTSSTDTESPQGNMAGHGISANQGYVGSFKSEEHGVIMSLLYVRPEADYMQGIDRQWLRRTSFDFPAPMFEGQSEQPILGRELYISNTADDTKIFGYAPLFDEVRTKRNMIVGEMRTVFKNWHLGREFSSAPSLNSSFIECRPRKDIFAVTDPLVPCMIMHVGNNLTVTRPFSPTAEQGIEKV